MELTLPGLESEKLKSHPRKKEQPVRWISRLITKCRSHKTVTAPLCPWKSPRISLAFSSTQKHTRVDTVAIALQPSHLIIWQRHGMAIVWRQTRGIPTAEKGPQSRQLNRHIHRSLWEHTYPMTRWNLPQWGFEVGELLIWAVLFNRPIVRLSAGI